MNKVMGLSIIIPLTIFIVYHRFSHPDMTDIRWFVEYWKIWGVWFLFSVIGVWIYKKDELA